MSIKYNSCNQNNYIDESDANSDSIIEQSPPPTPPKKKLRTIGNKAPLRKNASQIELKNETDLMEKLLEEFNQHEMLNPFEHPKEVSNCQDIKEVQTTAEQAKMPEQLPLIENKQNHKPIKVEASTSNNDSFFTLSRSPNGTQNQVLRELLEDVETKVNFSGFLGGIQNGTTIPKYKGITKPLQNTFSKNQHNLFVFYLIEEVLKFTPNNNPKNSCVQLIGQFRFNEQKKTNVLCSCEKDYDQNYQIKVDLREVMSVHPNFEEEIILFGMICFENNIPIVVAKFFQKNAVNYGSYVDLMLRLRTTVPRHNFNLICVKDDVFRYDETMVELNEEELFNDLIRNHSEEQLKTYEVSDS